MRRQTERGRNVSARKKPRPGDRKTLMLAAAAGLLLLSGTVGSTRAALTYYSENYTAQVEMYDIGVTLVETSGSGTKDISSRDYTGSGDIWEETQGALLEDMLEETGGKLQLGRNYKEELSVRNSGTIDQYVRVKVSKGWTGKSGERETTLAPSLIVLGMTDNGWIIDENASTEERTVLYWPQILPVGETTAPLCDTLKIDPSIADKVTVTETVENGVTTTTTTFIYDGTRFVLKAEVDAVQTHNAADAIKSAWGVDVVIGADGSLALAQGGN